MKTWPHKKWNPFVHLDFHKGIFLTGPIPVPVPFMTVIGSLHAKPPSMERLTDTSP